MAKFLSALMAGVLLATPVGAAAAPQDDLARVIADHWAWYLRNSPVFATSIGVRDYDAEIGDYSLAQADRQAAEAAAFLQRLDAIPDARLDAAGRTNKAVLSRMLRETVDGNRFPQRQVLFTSYYNPVQSVAGMADNLPFQSARDYESYLTRLAKFPAQMAEVIAISRAAATGGLAQPCVTLGGFEQSVSGVIVDDPAQSRIYEPFTRTRPADVSEAAWRNLQGRARALITEQLQPSFAGFASFFRDEYLPRCRQNVGVSSTPEGAAYYAFRVAAETTTDMSPQAIHELGLSEVARIRAQMETVAREAGFAGRAAFVEQLRTDARYYATTPEQLLAAAAWQAKRIDGLMPRFFGRLPRLPYGVRAIPAETAEGTTTAYYGPGSPPSGIAGTYYVNTSKLPQRPLYELPALTAHEAVPGHHHQIALQQELDLPDFRRYAAGFTAFVEGWGLYAERVGEDMGLYTTPAEKMGRLSYEMWRACRLVVDTGIHAFGWDKDRAVAFMADNTALSAANIDAEVNRYISWPGQALGYKVGEIRIRELRARAEQALGPRFDIRGFHDAVLEQGAVPLDVLEGQVDAWITSRRAAE
ncbi:uncharacterized protein (DUF885 family) [Sphingomonas jejuensis]|uniref:Uncharacterized protein (DUF885 family) n=1 Tax=Sphingomonas jejuensis TaxID=904715 RepID=A0ABX0XPK6_9SPHN|nr:DUF885 domain-containing protein [Sphingomonas jejuensis]NJC35153.1 uncharacterized protein (DUF885 family) [Sphingomonas jejuensis]